MSATVNESTKNKYTEKEARELFGKKAKEVKDFTDLNAFYKFLIEDTVHDYGTIVEAMSAFMIAAMRVVDNSPQGGITGFQSGCVGWAMIREFMSTGSEEDAPMRLVDYSNLLYPQYENKFDKVIGKDTHEWLIKKAKEKLADRKFANEYVVNHWRAVADGVVPFGFRVKEE